jgi:hypothetical protein
LTTINSFYIVREFCQPQQKNGKTDRQTDRTGEDKQIQRKRERKETLMRQATEDCKRKPSQKFEFSISQAKT